MIMRRAILGPMSIILLAWILFTARAAADEGGALYVGGNFGLTLSSYNRSALNDALVGTVDAAGAALTIGSAYVHSKHDVWSADIGYLVSPYFSVEASYLDLGALKYFARGTETETQQSIVGPVTHSASLASSLKISSRGPALALVGVLPMTDDWYLNGRIGAYEGKTTTDFTNVSGSIAHSGSESQSSTALLAGAGASYVLGAHWIVRLDFLYLDQVKEKLLGKSFSVSLLTAGVAYAF